MRNNREFDIIVWGASGFTGKLVAEYIYKNYKLKNLKWAIAGRNKLKLISIRESFLDDKIPIVIANSFDKLSLEKMVKRTSVICTTVGPYAKYGSLLVDSCINNKTHYCDIAGEAQWIRKIIDMHHMDAQENKVKIVNSCGFDSIPSDIGVYFIYRNILKKNLKIQMRVTNAKGTYSGGTYYSMQNVLKEASDSKQVKDLLLNPYGLNPSGHLNGPDKRDLMSIVYDKKIKSWIAPFMMAGINTKIVRRSNALTNYKYGKKFSYDEAIMTGGGIKGRIVAIVLSVPLIFFTIRPGSFLYKILNFFSPKPGEGPNKEKRENGFYNIRFYVFQKNSKTSIFEVTGDKDPGYGSTSKMLAESAICLAKDNLNKNFGVLSPSVAMGNYILDRLKSNAGLTFKKIG